MRRDPARSGLDHLFHALRIIFRFSQSVVFIVALAALISLYQLHAIARSKPSDFCSARKRHGKPIKVCRLNAVLVDLMREAAMRQRNKLLESRSCIRNGLFLRDAICRAAACKVDRRLPPHDADYISRRISAGRSSSVARVANGAGAPSGADRPTRLCQ